MTFDSLPAVESNRFLTRIHLDVNRGHLRPGVLGYTHVWLQCSHLPEEPHRREGHARVPFKQTKMLPTWKYPYTYSGPIQKLGVLKWTGGKSSHLIQWWICISFYIHTFTSSFSYIFFFLSFSLYVMLRAQIEPIPGQRSRTLKDENKKLFIVRNAVFNCI